MDFFTKQVKTYSTLDAKFSKGICYLADLARIGGRFLPSVILKVGKDYCLMEGDLLLSDKSYRAVAKLYSNGKSPILFDVLGDDTTQAKQNLKDVMRIYTNARAFNVNGLKDVARSRLVVKIMYAISSVITIGTAYECMLCFFSSDRADLAYIFAMLLSMLCFAAARVYYHMRMDELSMMHRR